MRDLKSMASTIGRVHILCLTAGALLGSTSLAHASGHLWLGAEYAGEGNIYRYNINSNTIDLVATPALPSGGSHWNNIATDGQYVYLGTPTTQYFGVADINTGQIVTSTTYSSSLAGHKEDGAYKCDTGNLWRATYSSNVLHETTTAGVLVQTYTGASLSGLVGLEWVGDTLYATHYNNGTFGTITFEGTTATYTVIPFTFDPPGTGDALAYDQDADVLYAVFNSRFLYRMSIDRGMVTPTLVVDLGTIGYPSGGLVDGMGWTGQCVAETCPQDIAPQPDGDGVVNVNDLLLVINSWGACPARPEDCPADIAPGNGDGVVNVNDLLAVINNWGPCR